MNNINTGVVYILTNPSFPEYVKIGYADDINKRLKELNRSECIPFAFRLYAYYEVSARLTDLKIHEMIDKINPNLRSIDNIDGKRRIREFYAMDAEDAYKILEVIAEMNNLQSNLHKVTPTDKEKVEDKEAQVVRLEAFKFSMCNLKAGDELEYLYDSSKKCYVLNDKKVEYEGEEYSLSALAQLFLKKNYNVAGPHYFKYNGEILCNLRDRLSKEDKCE